MNGHEQTDVKYQQVFSPEVSRLADVYNVCLMELEKYELRASTTAHRQTDELNFGRGKVKVDKKANGNLRLRSNIDVTGGFYF